MPCYPIIIVPICRSEKTSLRLSVGGVGAKDIIKPLFSLLKGNGRQRGNGNGGREGPAAFSDEKSQKKRGDKLLV